MKRPYLAEFFGMLGMLRCSARGAAVFSLSILPIWGSVFGLVVPDKAG
jgi:hypothetical protein